VPLLAFAAKYQFAAVRRAAAPLLLGTRRYAANQPQQHAVGK